MGSWEVVLSGLVMVLGLVGVVVPGMPGPLVVWAGVLWWSGVEDSARSWGVLAGATAVLLLNQAVKWLLPTRRMRDAGVSRRTFLLAGGVAVVGFFLLPVMGAPIGFIGAIYTAERRRLGGHGEAKASTRTAMRATGTSMLVELFACLLVTGAWVGALIAG